MSNVYRKTMYSNSISILRWSELDAKKRKSNFSFLRFFYLLIDSFNKEVCTQRQCFD